MNLKRYSFQTYIEQLKLGEELSLRSGQEKKEITSLYYSEHISNQTIELL